jgi:hypothetical protein
VRCFCATYIRKANEQKKKNMLFHYVLFARALLHQRGINIQKTTHSTQLHDASRRGAAVCGAASGEEAVRYRYRIGQQNSKTRAFILHCL